MFGRSPGNLFTLRNFPHRWLARELFLRREVLRSRSSLGPSCRRIPIFRGGLLPTTPQRLPQQQQCAKVRQKIYILLPRGITALKRQLQLLLLFVALHVILRFCSVTLYPLQQM